MNSKHSYSSAHKFSKGFLYFLAIAFFVFGLSFPINLIISLVQGKDVSILGSIESFLVLSVFLPLLHLCVDFLETDIYTDEYGLTLKSPIKTFYIKWDDVVEIRRASLFGIPMFNKPSIVITNSKLSPFHYVYGVVYARKFQPSFFFSKFINDSDSLRRAIIEGIKKSRLAKQVDVKKPV